MKLVLFLFMPLTLLAQTPPSYEEIIKKFNHESIPVVRKKIINDDYLCTIYTPDYQPQVIEEKLRIKKWGQTDVIISYPGTELNKVILSPFEKISFKSDHIVLKKMSLGHLMILNEEKIFDCFFPPNEDIFWD